MLTSLLCKRASVNQILTSQRLWTRSYALSRNGDRPVGTGRTRSNNQNSRLRANPRDEAKQRQTQSEQTGSSGQQSFWEEGAARAASSAEDADAGLRRLLMSRDTLVIERYTSNAFYERKPKSHSLKARLK
jgi:hypothetical protein